MNQVLSCNDCKKKKWSPLQPCTFQELCAVGGRCCLCTSACLRQASNELLITQGNTKVGPEKGVASRDGAVRRILIIITLHNFFSWSVFLALPFLNLLSNIEWNAFYCRMLAAGEVPVQVHYLLHVSFAVVRGFFLLPSVFLSAETQWKCKLSARALSSVWFNC